MGLSVTIISALMSRAAWHCKQGDFMEIAPSVISSISATSHRSQALVRTKKQHLASHNLASLHSTSSRRKSRGTTTVEFAIAGSLFLLLMFSVMDFALLGFANLTMQNAVREGARYAITGQTNLDPDNTADRKKAIVQKIKNHSMGFFDQVMTESDILVKDSNGNALVGFGDPGQYVVITLNCSWPVLSPFTQLLLTNNAYQFSVSAAMRNENFPGAGP